MTEELITRDEAGNSLFDIPDDFMAMPPAKNVKLKIVSILPNDKYGKKHAQAGEERPWKFYDVDFLVVDGFEVNGEIKYAGKHVFDMICYSVSKVKYDFEKDFFKGKKFLLKLKNLLTATGFTDGAIDEDETKVGIAENLICKISTDIEGKVILASIRQTKNKESGEVNGNETAYYKALPDTMLA